MKKIALSDVKDDFSRFLRMAESEEIVITRHGKAAGVLIGFESEDDWFDYRLEQDPRFLQRIASARASLAAGKGILIEDIKASEQRPRGGGRKAVSASRRRATRRGRRSSQP